MNPVICWGFVMARVGITPTTPRFSEARRSRPDVGHNTCIIAVSSCVLRAGTTAGFRRVLDSTTIRSPICVATRGVTGFEVRTRRVHRGPAPAIGTDRLRIDVALRAVHVTRTGGRGPRPGQLRSASQTITAGRPVSACSKASWWSAFARDRAPSRSMRGSISRLGARPAAADASR